jgi:hypothetical protein
VKEIGHKLRMINEYSRSLVDVKDETLEIICDIITLWLNSIMFFRTQTLGTLETSSYAQSLIMIRLNRCRFSVHINMHV